MAGGEAGIRTIWRGCAFKAGSELGRPTARDGARRLGRATGVRGQAFAGKTSRTDVRSVSRGCCGRSTRRGAITFGRAEIAGFDAAAIDDDFLQDYARIDHPDFERVVSGLIKSVL